MTSRARKVVIIGGGISGLSAAFKLRELCAEEPVHLTVLEASSRWGGVIETETVDDCLIECGPDNILTAKPWGVDLMKSLGMQDRILETNTEYRRAFIAGSDCLLPMPEGFRLIAPDSIAALAASPCMSFPGKLRAAFEPFIPKHHAMAAGKLPDDFDESLASFVTRRLGRETLDKLAQPLFSGIYTADPETLSMRATMPQFLEYEAQFGSVIRGLKDQKPLVNNGHKTESVRYSMFVAPKEGMASLIHELKSQLNSKNVSLESDTFVSSLCYLKEKKRWRISVADEAAMEADAVLLCLPAYGAARLLRENDALVADLLSSIKYASSAVVNFIVDRESILHKLDGFGFVVPAFLNKSILAAGFSSVKYKGRAPDNLAVLRAFVGGALFSHLLELSDSEIRDRAFDDLSFYLSIRTPRKGPAFREAIVTRWQNAMPQYAVGHRGTVKAIEERMSELPGAFICGGAYEGVGIPDCIRNSGQAAEAVKKFLLQINDY